MTPPQRKDQAIPAAFLTRMESVLGSDYPEFFSSLQLPATSGLRVNTHKISTADFLHRSPYELSPVPWCPSGYTIEAPSGVQYHISPGKHPYHAAGLYYLQEPSAMAAAEILAPQPGERVLDLAAAPGGKATHLSALMKNCGVLVANEIHPRRVWDLAENLERCGVANAIITNETPQRLADHFGAYFDRVLIDAPCSGEGMFRKGDISRIEWKPELVRSCAIRQSAILEQAARMVKVEGELVYSTCTFSTDENEGVIVGFLNNHPDFDLVSIQQGPGFYPAMPGWMGLPPDHPIKRAIRIWPHHANAEGHFIALLVRKGSSRQSHGNNASELAHISNRTMSTKVANTDFTVFEEYCHDNLTLSFDRSRLSVDGSYLYQRPENSPQLDGLKVIHPGWWLGSISKARFIPSHSMAIGIKAAEARLLLPFQLGDSRLAAYIAGESFVDEGDDGWVLVTVDDFPIGWGKRVQNKVKNFYPHGLRRPS